MRQFQHYVILRQRQQTFFTDWKPHVFFYFRLPTHFHQLWLVDLQMNCFKRSSSVFVAASQIWLKIMEICQLL